MGFPCEAKKSHGRQLDQMYAKHRDEKSQQAKRQASRPRGSDCALASVFFSFFVACCGVGQTKWFTSTTVSVRKPGSAVTGNKKSPAQRRGF